MGVGVKPHVYELLEHLGSGASGSVHRTRDRDGLDRALKVLVNPEPDALRRFEREARLLAKATDVHNIVKIYDIRLDDPKPFFTMELCDGSLRDFVGKMSEEEAITCIAQAALGLHFLHKNCGFHRDIKPGNLLYIEGDNGRVVKVGDMGLARLPTDLSFTQMWGGTFGYIAPEVGAGSPFESASDIYSLGITLIELVTGERNPKNAAKLQSVEVQQIVKAMVAADPEKRPKAQDVWLKFSRMLTPQPAPNVTKPVARPRKAGGDWVGGLLLGLLGVAAIATVASLADSDKK